MFERCIVPSRSCSSGDSSATTPNSSQPLLSLTPPDKHANIEEFTVDALVGLEDILVDADDYVPHEVHHEGEAEQSNAEIQAHAHYEDTSPTGFTACNAIPDTRKHHSPPADMDDGEDEWDSTPKDATWYVQFF